MNVLMLARLWLTVWGGSLAYASVFSFVLPLVSPYFGPIGEAMVASMAATVIAAATVRGLW